MLSRMTSAEVTRWQGYEKVSGPLGPERHDALAAMQAFYMLRSSGAKHVKLSDLMPQWDRPERQTPQEHLAAIRSMHRAFGGNPDELG